MTRGSTTNHQSPCPIRCGLIKVGSSGPEPLSMVRGDDEIALWVKFLPSLLRAGTVHDLTVELWRGDDLRDRWQRMIRAEGEAGGCLLWRLHWGDRPGSSRLRCRVIWDGVEVTELRLIIGTPAADAQGRLPAEFSDRPSSEATLLDFAALLDQQISEQSGVTRRK